MFTVTIETQDGLQQSIREWPTCDIFRLGNENFNAIMADELDRLKSMFAEDEGDAQFLVNQYKAVLRSVCGEFTYYLTLNENAYVSNSHGKTIAAVK